MEEIFDWAHERKADLSTEYIQGYLDITVDLDLMKSGDQYLLYLKMFVVFM